MRMKQFWLLKPLLPHYSIYTLSKTCNADEVSPETSILVIIIIPVSNKFPHASPPRALK